MNTLIDSCKELVETADNTGCSEDLTVVSADKLQKVIDALKELDAKTIDDHKCSKCGEDGFPCNCDYDNQFNR